MLPRTMLRWVFGLAVVLLVTGFAYGGECQFKSWQFDSWQFTPSADTEYKVDIYGVRPPTLSKPYETWVLLQDDHAYAYAGYVPEFGYYRWHLTVGGNSPGVFGAYGNVSCRTNGFAWQAVRQISGQSGPGLMESDAAGDEVASADSPARVMSYVSLMEQCP